jgi:ADP-heptose:LPS heptosyltransferase
MHQGALGDVLLSLPALYSLGRYHKRNPLTLVGNPESLSLLQGPVYGQAIFPGHHRDWAGLYQKKAMISEGFRKFLSSFKRAYLFAKHPPAELIQGLKKGGIEKITWIPSFPDEKKRIPLQVLQQEVYQAQSIPWLKAENVFYVPRENLHQARELLAHFRGPGKKRPLWAVHPGSGSLQKNWPLERFIQAAQEIERKNQGQPIFLLGPAEQETEPAGFFRSQPFPVMNTPPLKTLAGILSQCAGYLGNDSGVSHLAAALGLPSVVLFGPTDPFLWGPRGRSVHLLFSSRSCSPCSEESRRTCPDKDCLMDISVEQVLETISAVSKETAVRRVTFGVRRN